MFQAVKLFNATFVLMLRYLAFILLIIGVLSCTYYEHEFLYDFEKPTKVVRLKKQLKEISGLSYKNDSTLYAIQDEEGKIFEIDLILGKAETIIDFKKSGDFEGIATVGKVFYVLRSDGSIYEVTEKNESKKYTFFDDDKDFDFEGICSNKESLLVACKQHGKKAEDDFIWIYKFSLQTKQYDQKEFLKIPKEKVHEKFKASAIAIDPTKGLIHLLAANTFTLASFNWQGELINKAQLPFTGYPQAEGICFSPSGTLYISSEKGDQEKGKIIILEKNEK